MIARSITSTSSVAYTCVKTIQMEDAFLFSLCLSSLF